MAPVVKENASRSHRQHCFHSPEMTSMTTASSVSEIVPPSRCSSSMEADADADDSYDDHERPAPSLSRSYDETSSTSTPLESSRIPPSPKSADTPSLPDIAQAELQELWQQSSSSDSPSSQPTTNASTSQKEVLRQSFPAACRALLLDLPGNSRCLDCGISNPEWAAVSYGAMVCLQCAGSHRSMGVNVSTVRSVTMDHWRYEEVVKMLEGGNRQLHQFFDRHGLDKDASDFQSPQLNSSNVAKMRYKTKAALFYRQQLERHVENVLQTGPYQGRRQTRRNRPRRPLGTHLSNLE